MKKIPHNVYGFAPLVFSLALTTSAFAADAANDNSGAAAPAASQAASAPQEAPKAEAVKSGDDAKTVDFNAKDVWDKKLFDKDDNKVLVIQDRKYNKAQHLELGVDVGMTAASAFFNSYSVGLRSAYYFSEYWGIQAFGTYSLNTPTNEKKQLDDYLYTSGFQSTKEYQQPEFFGGLGFVWSPIYGKFAWFRSRIIHFDIYAGLGLSVLQNQSTFNDSQVGATRASINNTYLGSLENIGIRIFISKDFAWTTEVRNNIYQARYADTSSGGGTEAIPAKTVWENNFQFMSGVSYLIDFGGR